MPTYDYVCDACQHAFELYQSIKDDAQRRCPKCKKLKLRRLIGAGAAIVFKGSGFYQTDYRSEAYKKSAASESKAQGDGGSGDKKSGDSKPAETKATDSGSKGGDSGKRSSSGGEGS